MMSYGSPSLVHLNDTLPRQKIAFLVLAHEDPVQLRRLCQVLGGFVVFIHIDAKSKGFSEFNQRPIQNVRVLEQSLPIYWGDFSIVEATLELLRTALGDVNRFDRFVLLSGACYPVKPLKALVDLFLERPTTQFVQLTKIGTTGTHLRRIISRHYRMKPFLPESLRSIPPVAKADQFARRVWNKVSSYLPRRLEQEIGNLNPYFGSQWWSITRDCAEYIDAFCSENPTFLRSYRSIYAPDEHFFHTIIANSPFVASALPETPDMGAQSLYGAPLHLVHPSGNRAFGDKEEDLRLALETDKFFIRKVSSYNCGRLLDQVDRELLKISFN
jgi:hypothetical protein